MKQVLHIPVARAAVYLLVIIPDQVADHGDIGNAGQTVTLLRK
jgi:hypothetical protein